jgi:ribosomal protein S18 acetylase RimI-like enzyme
VREVRFDDPVVQGLLAEWDDELGFAPKGGSPVEATDFAVPDGVFLVASVGEAAVGCGGVRRLGPTAGEVKRLFVRRAARRSDAGRSLLAALEERAVGLGLDELRLDTASDEPAALALFRSAGYEPVADYNGNPHARHWFAKRLAPR